MATLNLMEPQWTYQMLLSIIIPFYNASKKINPLIEELSSIQKSDIEVIFSNDGSTESEHEALISATTKLKCSYHIVSQNNKGPGGARNLGRKKSLGKYLWFVDADDSIDLRAIDKFRELSNETFDFIDFDIEKKGIQSSSMPLNPGAHNVDQETRKILLKSFGRICTKIFRKSFIVENRFFYPENCIYEDNYLTFTIPLKTTRFFRCEIVSYYHNVNGKSVTRTKTKTIDPKYFDRLFTAKDGAELALRNLSNGNERSIITGKLRSLFLIISSKKLLNSEISISYVGYVFSAYKEVIRSILSETEQTKELCDARRMLLASAGEKSSEVACIWDDSKADHAALEKLLIERDDAWESKIYYPID